MFVEDLAIPYVYGPDKHWAAEQKAGTVSFEGSAGWHRALQEFVDMSNAGCFEPGMTGTAAGSGPTLFSAGQGLMDPGTSSLKGLIDAADPQFAYSFHPFPGGSAPNATQVFVTLSDNLSINAHSSAAAQAAAQTFVNFVARPKQNALYAQIRGSLTQYQFLHEELPSFMPTTRAGRPARRVRAQPGPELVERERPARHAAGRDRPDHRADDDRRDADRDGRRLETGAKLGGNARAAALPPDSPGWNMS